MEQFNTIINGNIPVLVDFFATWCAPCRTMAPILEHVKRELGDNIRIIKIDVDKNPILAQSHQIRSVPTIKLFKNGQVRWTGSGVIQARELVSVIQAVNS